MSSKAFSERLSRALESTGLTQVVDSGGTDIQIRVLCRVLQGSEPKWMKLVHAMLLATEASAGKAFVWHAHICRVYFLKDIDDTKKMVFGWNITINSQDLSTSLDFLDRVIRGEAPDVRYSKHPGEVDEMPFTGVVGERGAPNARGKGAWDVGGKNSFRVNSSSSGVTK